MEMLFTCGFEALGTFSSDGEFGSQFKFVSPVNQQVPPMPLVFQNYLNRDLLSDGAFPQLKMIKLENETEELKTHFNEFVNRIVACAKSWNRMLMHHILFGKWYKPSLLKKLAESVECLDEYEKYIKIFHAYLRRRRRINAAGQVELAGDREWDQELLGGDLATISDIPALIRQMCTSDPGSDCDDFLWKRGIKVVSFENETRELKFSFEMLLQNLITHFKSRSDDVERNRMLEMLIKKIRSDETVPSEYLSLSVDRLFSHMKLGRSLKWYKPSVLKELAESVECLDGYEKYIKIFHAYLRRRIMSKNAAGQVELAGDKEWEESLEGDLAAISDIPALIHQSDADCDWKYYFTEIKGMKSSRRRSSVFTFIDGKKVDTNNKGMKEGGCDDLKQHHVVCVPVEESSYDDEKSCCVCNIPDEYRMPLLIVTNVDMSNDDIKKIVKNLGKDSSEDSESTMTLSM